MIPSLIRIKHRQQNKRGRGGGVSWSSSVGSCSSSSSSKPERKVKSCPPPNRATALVTTMLPFIVISWMCLTISRYPLETKGTSGNRRNKHKQHQNDLNLLKNKNASSSASAAVGDDYYIDMINRIVSSSTTTKNHTTSPPTTITAVPKAASPTLRSSKQKAISSSLSTVGERIVQESYQQTFALLVDNCPFNQTIVNCIDRIQTTIMNKNSSNQQEQQQQDSSSPTWWWFTTMLRDAVPPTTARTGGGPMYGFWHNLTIENPRIDFCAIEKIGTKNWRKVQCQLNHGTNGNNNEAHKWMQVKSPTKAWKTRGQPCQANFTKLKLLGEEQHKHHNNTSRTTAATATAKPTPTARAASRVVFLRDPLERFLSGFIDKCVSYAARTFENHCEPLEIFQPSQAAKESSPEASSENSNNTNQYDRDDIHNMPSVVGLDGLDLDDIRKDKKRFFETYVDLMPLKWNMHFFPQSLYCDGIYRHIKQYDFVGRMGPNFYDDIHELGMQFMEESPALAKTLDDIFKAKTKLSNHKNIGHVDTTTAASNVADYYTPRTVRKVLQYMAIDYIHLDIPIPMWAEQMLLQKEQDDDDVDDNDTEYYYPTYGQKAKQSI